MPLQRLDKIIASMGQHSRKDVKNLIKAKKISVNGTVVSGSDMKCDPELDEIMVDGIRLNYSEHIYIMLNKPAGVVSATSDAHDKTVLDLIPTEYRKPDMFPVGRLDKDTEGLLLLTDDGALAHDLLSPKKHVDKTYFVRVEGSLRDTHVKAFADGVTLADGYKCMGAELVILNSGKSIDTGSSDDDCNEVNCASDTTQCSDNITNTNGTIVDHDHFYTNDCGISEALIAIKEGKFHQIKRMFGTINMPVLYLKRIKMGCLSLDDALEPGQFRKLTEDEIMSLKR